MVRIMQQKAKLVCINPNCGKTYSIKSLAIKCDSCNFLLDVKYENKPSSNLKRRFTKEEIHKEVFIMKVACGDLENY